MYIPRWIGRLMAQERARTTGVAKPIEPFCPAGLENIEIVHISKKPSYIACANYERVRGISEIPSRECCPGCRYNTDNIRRLADEKLSASLASFRR